MTPLPFVLMILSAAPEPAPTPASTSTLGVEDAVARALARSPLVLAAAASTDAAAARVDQAGSAWLPRVLVEAHYRYQGPVPELEIAVPNTPISMKRELGTDNAADAFVTVGWRALDLGPRAARIAAADALVRAAEADARGRRVEIAFAARAAWLSLWVTEAAQATTGEALAVARQARADADRRRGAGTGSAVAVAAADLRVAELEARQGDARKGVAKATAALEQLIGPVEAGLALAGPTAIPDAPAGSLDEHPALAKTRAAEAALAAQSDAARAARWPTLDLFARLGLQYPATLVDTDEAGPAWAVGATLSWDVFDGGRAGAEAEQNAAQAREVAHQRDALRDDLTRQAAEARAQLEAATTALHAAEKRVAAAQVYLDAARGAVTAGAALETDRQNAEAGLDQAELALLQARFDGAMAEAQALRALGIAERPTTAPSASPAPTAPTSAPEEPRP